MIAKPPVIIMRCETQKGDLVGYVLHMHPDGVDTSYCIFSDQAAMPGVRVGGEFTPSFGASLLYTDIEQENKRLRSALEEIHQDETENTWQSIAIKYKAIAERALSDKQ